MKKQISLWFAAIMILGAINIFAQKPFAGTVSFAFTVEGTDDPNKAAELSGVTMDYIVMGNCTKMSVSEMGIGVENITNGDDKVVSTVIDVPGYGKYYIEKNEADLKKAFETTKFDYNYTDETKEVAGYTCKKVIVTVTDLETDEEESFFAWVTNDLQTGDNINFSTYPGLKGYPLRMDIPQEDGNETYYIVQYAKSVTPSKKIKLTEFYRSSNATNLEEASEDVKTALKQMLGM